MFERVLRMDPMRLQTYKLGRMSIEITCPSLNEKIQLNISILSLKVSLFYWHLGKVCPDPPPLGCCWPPECWRCWRDSSASPTPAWPTASWGSTQGPAMWICGPWRSQVRTHEGDPATHKRVLSPPIGQLLPAPWSLTELPHVSACPGCTCPGQPAHTCPCCAPGGCPCPEAGALRCVQCGLEDACANGEYKLKQRLN